MRKPKTGFIAMLAVVLPLTMLTGCPPEDSTPTATAYRKALRGEDKCVDPDRVKPINTDGTPAQDGK